MPLSWREAWEYWVIRDQVLNRCYRPEELIVDVKRMFGEERRKIRKKFAKRREAIEMSV